MVMAPLWNSLKSRSIQRNDYIIYYDTLVCVLVNHLDDLNH